MVKPTTMMVLLGLVILAGCAGTEESSPDPSSVSPDLDDPGPSTPPSGEVKMIPIVTPKGDTFNVWTKRVGNNPTVKILLLHGGPGASHEYFEVFDEFFPAQGFEYYYYDQLGSHFSDQPNDPDLLKVSTFVEEVEQVRQALGLNKDNFFLFGHSWGGILAIEYALEYSEHLKGLIISNMMASIPDYNEYAENVLKPDMDPTALAEIEALEAAGDYENPRYMELLKEHHYVDHFLRIPPDEWPDAVLRTFEHLNPEVYVPMQGPSELGASGILANWDRFDHLQRIKPPTLVIGARYDTMDPDHMEAMAERFQNARYHLCTEGSHLALYDDQESFMTGLIEFINDVDRGWFPAAER